MSKKKKNRKQNGENIPVITGHDCKAETESPSRGRFEERDSDMPDGTTGNYS